MFYSQFYLTCIFFSQQAHDRNISQVLLGPIRATFSHFSPVQTSPALSIENTIKEGCLRRGAGIYLFQIIPFLVFILQGQCNVTPESPHLYSTRGLYPCWMSCNSMQPECQSMKFLDLFSLNTKLYGMAHRNFTYWNSDDCDKPELILKALSSFKDMNIRILTQMLLQLFLLMFTFWLC